MDCKIPFPCSSFPSVEVSILWNRSSVSSHTLTTLADGLKSPPLSLCFRKVCTWLLVLDPRALQQEVHIIFFNAILATYPVMKETAACLSSDKLMTFGISP